MNSSLSQGRELPDCVFPLLCFTKDGDVWAVRDEFELTTCGPQTLADGMQIGMDIVDAAGHCWRVKSVRHVGYPPLTWRSFRPFLARLRRIEHEFEVMPGLTLEETQDRVCTALEAFPEYWCELEDKDSVLPERKDDVRRTRSIAEIHDVLGLDWFGE